MAKPGKKEKKADKKNFDSSKKIDPVAVKREEDERLAVFDDVLKSEAKDEKIDMTRMTRKKPRPWGRIIFFSSLFLIVLAAVLGFFFFTSGQRFTGERVRIFFEAPDHIASGGETSLKLLIENDEAVTLRDAEVSVTYPDGFSIVSTSVNAINDAQNAFALGDLRSGQAKSLTLTGIFVGDVGSERSITATLSYVPATFNSEFVTQARETLQIEASNLSMRFNGPARVIPETEIPYELVLENTSSDTVGRVRVILESPEAFRLQSSEPNPEVGQSWTFENVSAGDDQSISFQGLFSGEVGNLHELVVRVGTLADDGSFQLQTEKRIIVQLVQPELSIDFTVNGADSDRAVSLGSTLQYVLKYGNQTDEVIRDVEVQLELLGEAVDWDSIVDPFSANRESDILVWTKDQVEELAELRPGSKGEITVSVDLLDSFAIDAAPTNPEVISQATVRGQAEELGSSQIDTSSDPVALQIITQFSLISMARYYDSEFVKLGDGPLPPQVGQMTSYRVFWTVQNTVNAVSGIEIQTTIPSDVFWTGRNIQTSIGSLSFNPEDRSITWTISSIPAGAGISENSVQASFELSVTPRASDLGKVLILTDATQASGVDTFTQEDISVTDDSLTTNLDGDQYGQGQGEVVDGTDEES